MGYEDLVKRSWRNGDYVIDFLAKAASQAAGRVLFKKEVIQEKVRKEMEALAEREAGDAVACLNAHREGIMKLAPFVKFREEKFGAVLFETRSEKVFTLSPTGAAVVREVIAGADSRSLVERLKMKYDDKNGKMEAEALGFLAELKEKGLVTE